ncbi:hypothetical protein JCM17380_35370 [Desulfosporosinus burensis]
MEQNIDLETNNRGTRHDARCTKDQGPSPKFEVGSQRHEVRNGSPKFMVRGMMHDA